MFFNGIQDGYKALDLIISERLEEETDCMGKICKKMSELLCCWAGTRNSFEKKFYICSET